MKRWFRSLSILLMCFVLIALLAGCSYLKKRGNDASDVFDMGFTLSKKPQFGLYLDWFNITPMGYSNIDGWLLGWGMRHAGLPAYRENSWGVLVMGSEQRGIGTFNPQDPHQASPSYEGSGEEHPRYDAGVIDLIKGNNRPPITHHIDCNKGFHIGFIGITNTCRPVDILDFVLGWTTLDLMGDDNIAE